MSKNKLNLFKNYKKLEDNVTHGFLATLQCIKESSAKSIIESIIPGLKLQNGIKYDIQSPSVDSRRFFQNARNGYILGISSIDTLVHEDSSSRELSRADGWICDGESLILIESKVVSEFSNDQINRHKKQFANYNIQHNSVPFIRSTWQEVDIILKQLLKEAESEVEKNICIDFRRYIQMEGITLDFEKFYNATEENIDMSWDGDDPKTTLKLLKTRILRDTRIGEDKKEQIHEDKMNYYWLRLFQNHYSLINWRSSVYINPDAVSVDVAAFRPNKKKLEEVISKIIKIVDAIKQYPNNNLQTWLYISNYGKRRNVQSGRNYDYCTLNYNCGKGPEYFQEQQNLFRFAKSIKPKQIGVRYSISNPGSKSNTYWKGSGSDVNHIDADLLKNPEKVVNKFIEFLKISLDILSN